MFEHKISRISGRRAGYRLTYTMDNIKKYRYFGLKRAYAFLDELRRDTEVTESSEKLSLQKLIARLLDYKRKHCWNQAL